MNPTDPKLSSAQRVLTALASDRWAKDPGQLAYRSGLSESTVRRQLKLLREQNLVSGPLTFGVWRITGEGNRYLREQTPEQAAA